MTAAKHQQQHKTGALHWEQPLIVHLSCTPQLQNLHTLGTAPQAEAQPCNKWALKPCASHDCS